ncbi:MULTISPECIES: cysteine desulfurase family protein [unclassified Nitrobacter]|uniref:cysteine desulfurase family protein n=1 Tax=unclassified Nitrobacter TaxID=2620411 RepID=UPI0002FD626B|nr:MULTISPECIES: cysteine desulfurase family protein [unclassified Nitrobacter]MCV0385369.1 cysteine desulfurase [Nitrobacter sp.]
MQKRTYLDWNATAPLRREARAAMAAAWEVFGNPSSIHAEGRRARGLIEEARTIVAEAVGGEPRNVIFTSGGTEANALALTPIVRKSNQDIDNIIISSIEHASALAGGRFAPDRVRYLPVHRSGLVDLNALRTMLAQGPPVLVSIMLANNETGAIQPVAEAAHLIREAGGLLHVDAVQAIGKISIDINALNADFLSLSAHKVGGPKGMGALVLAENQMRPSALIRGGGQERGGRAGTENVPGIVGFGAAVMAAEASRVTDMARIQTLRNRLEEGLGQTQGGVIFSQEIARLPNTTLFGVPTLKAETAVIRFDLEGVSVSSGSACSSGKVQPSHVLKAMGYGPEITRSAIRFSLGWETTEADIDRTIKTWRKLSGALLRRDETGLEPF